MRNWITDMLNINREIEYWKSEGEGETEQLKQRIVQTINVPRSDIRVVANEYEIRIIIESVRPIVLGRDFIKLVWELEPKYKIQIHSKVIDEVKSTNNHFFGGVENNLNHSSLNVIDVVLKPTKKGSD